MGQGGQTTATSTPQRAVSTAGREPGTAICRVCHVIPLMGNVQDKKIHRDREWVHGCQGLGRGVGGDS